MTVLLTGATGFLGWNLFYSLERNGHSIIPVVRPEGSRPIDLFEKKSISKLTPLVVDRLSEITPSIYLEKRAKSVIHCAGLAHTPAAPPELYHEVNTELTLNLARNAAEGGVKRFIFFSSIGVNGASSLNPFRADDEVAPYDDYTESKYNAEQGLKAIARETDMEVVIIRAPLIYGRNAPGNFGKLVKLVKLPIPIPLGGINNKRSFVSVDNLSHFTHCCLTFPSAANEIFLVSDGEDLSTTQFLLRISKAIDRHAQLIPVPVSILRILAGLLGKQSVIDKMTVNLQVDIEKNKTLMGWKPLVSVDEALKRALLKKSN